MTNENSDQKPMASEAEVGRAARGFDSNRRKLTVTGLSAPILMTLMSKPALAGNCLSNMMSGNLSDPNRGQCNKGQSPGGWGKIVGKIDDSFDVESAWMTAGYDFDKSLLVELYGWLRPDVDVSGLKTSQLKMSEVLNPPYSKTTTRTYVTAWLNANLSANLGAESGWKYILTPTQVRELILDPSTVPYGLSAKDFFHTTWDD